MAAIAPPIMILVLIHSSSVADHCLFARVIAPDVAREYHNFGWQDQP
jgi:hypothetical protein